MSTRRDSRNINLSCSFCGKSQREVKKLIAGPTVYICDECIRLCNDIIAEEKLKDSALGPKERIPPPTEIKAFLDECLAIEGGKEAFSARGLGDGNAYGLSKACANSYTVLLAREHPALRINACTPGFIETDMTRDYAASQGKTPAEMGMQPPASGARAPLFLLFGEPEGNGRFYGSDAQRSPLDRYRAPGTEPYRG